MGARIFLFAPVVLLPHQSTACRLLVHRAESSKTDIGPKYHMCGW
jgi:hypothetical protein